MRITSMLQQKSFTIATLNATNNFNVTADNFFNTNTSLEDGNINADTFSLL